MYGEQRRVQKEDFLGENFKKMLRNVNVFSFRD